MIGEHCIEPDQSLTIELAMPAGLLELDPNAFRRFPSHVWRVRLSGTHRIHFVDLDTGGHECAAIAERNAHPPLAGLRLIHHAGIQRLAH